MKSLVFFFTWTITLIDSAQSFPVRNVNDKYVVTSLKGSDKFKNNIKEVLRDNKGLYWFQNVTDISSFDGVNWKSYSFKSATGRNIPLRINEIEATEDGAIWLATVNGLSVFDPMTENFIPMRQLYTGISGFPAIANCIYKGLKNFLFISVLTEGFYLFDWNTKLLKYVKIDSANKTKIPIDGEELDVTVDGSGNYWGLTTDSSGIWCYNNTTGRISCSWKGELPIFPAKNYSHKYISGLTFSEKENVLWLSYGPAGILEKKYVATGKSIFYTFSGDLKVNADTMVANRHKIMTVKSDRDKN